MALTVFFFGNAFNIQMLLPGLAAVSQVLLFLFLKP
jgi:hypothetical protein